jgi:hypothetical protein
MGGVVVGAFVGGFLAASRGGNPIKGMALGALAGWAGGAMAGTEAAVAGESTLGAVAPGEALASTTAVEGTAGALGEIAPVADLASGAGESFGLTGTEGAVVGGGGAEVVGGSQLVGQGTSGALTQNAVDPIRFADAGVVTSDAGPQYFGENVVDSSSAASAEGPTFNPAEESPYGPGETPGRVEHGPAAATNTPGLIDKWVAWANANPALAAGVMMTGGQMVGGLGGGIGQYLTMQEKADLELRNAKELKDYYRRHVQSGSAGGGGVNINARPGQSKVLTDSSGNPVKRYI